MVDRSGVTVDEYWQSKGIKFVDTVAAADLVIRKAELSLPQNEFFEDERSRAHAMGLRPSILLIGEPRELAPAAYRFADPQRSLVVAPGQEFERFTFGRPWSDPQLDDWHKRLDRFVWIGRPIGHRLAIAKRLVEMGLPLDIYSREPWPLDCWKGPAIDDVETARAYKFRIACENSDTYLYHSEKLFTGIRSGCVNFYWGDRHLDLSFAKGAYVPLRFHNLKDRYDLAPQILEGMHQFMFSTAWTVYSVRSFIDAVAKLIVARVNAQWSDDPQCHPLGGDPKQDSPPEAG